MSRRLELSCGRHLDITLPETLLDASEAMVVESLVAALPVDRLLPADRLTAARELVTGSSSSPLVTTKRTTVAIGDDEREEE